MTSMTHDGPRITGGVDTHGLTHHAAVIDSVGRHLADREFEATIRGYRELLDWMRSHGDVVAVGVEGTGAYGAELARVLTAAGVTVIDVDRPDRKTRRMKGKSDPIDAYAAAMAVLSGRAAGIPKSRDGVVEAVRVLRLARRSAVKARTQAMNQ
ncbi:IS110 family transposase, partial [Streptomyces parvus]|uniref:IS110 family transposase n=1 Tax=Streptomyces parvus TaxID=66428 RepID=UPI003802C266